MVENELLNEKDFLEYDNLENEDSEDEEDFSDEDNNIDLEDIEILENDEEGVLLRLIIKDGSWKNLFLEREVLNLIKNGITDEE